MISKKQISKIASLHRKKFRKEHGLFIAEGEKICNELLLSGWAVENFFITEEFRENKFSDLTKKISYQIISEDDLRRISALSTPQQVLAVVQIPARKFSDDMLKDRLTLMLDNIKDPGNLGTIIRIADWFGIENIVCSETCADAYNPKTVQAAMGSLFRVKVFYESLETVLKGGAANNIHVYGTVLEGANIYHERLDDKGIILIGSESHGINSELMKFVTKKISIPSFSGAASQKPDSLNAAMAAAIVCSEFRRTRFAN